MRKIGFVATESYYVDHLASVWLSLPVGRRGPFFCSPKAYPTAVNRGVNRGSLVVVQGDRKQVIRTLAKHPNLPVCSASFSNWRMVTQAGLPNPTLVHGQGGPGNNGNAPWIEQADKIDLMLVPAPYGQSGLGTINTKCMMGQPKLDRWYGYKPSQDSSGQKRNRPILAISFRWREAHCALDHYKPFLKEIKSQALDKGVHLLGHGHPLKFHTDFKQMWQNLGIEATPHFETVLERADVYAADCSSSSYEFVALDRPVIFLHHPKYEKWDFAPRFTHCRAGITNWDPSQLIDDALRAYEDPPEIQLARREVAQELFGDFRGEASKNAAKLLMEMYN